ncbi:hypothetical protein SAMN05421791_104125 [Facklamia miroungae]|uniref:Uncharacterized protein n=1 Tax=Facklamia miroungae TaxID=120956 RepID=A0A1G7STC4_9LACT|nr:hypothetical protein SAMN05421791_104125 [Facklamia miroungae]
MNHYLSNYPRQSSYYHRMDGINFSKRLNIHFAFIIQLEKSMIAYLKTHPLILIFFMVIGMPLCILLAVATVTTIFSLLYLFIL